MRRVAHATVWFDEITEPRIRQLMKLQCSAARSAYQAIHKHGLKDNDVKIQVKKNYGKELNQRYVSDACSLASGIVFKNALFGGKQSWLDLQTGVITKKEWSDKRNSSLYSRGDRSKNGNPNIRIAGNRLLVNDPSQMGLWLEGSLFLPKKFKDIDMSCYAVRLIHRQGKFLVKIGWEQLNVPKLHMVDGAVGVDCNPDGVSVVEVDGSGNLLGHTYELEQRIQFAKEDKRDNDVRLLAKRVVDKAMACRKPIVLEQLDFKKKGKKRSYRKFRRMAHNFVHRKMLDAIEARAYKQGVEVWWVDPAFTSVLGNLKYKNMYSLNRHTAAGLVIARRGMGLLERMDFKVRPVSVKSSKLNLEGRGLTVILTDKACSYLLSTWVKVKKPGLTGPPLAPCSQGIDGSVGATPTGESVPITGRDGMDEIPMGW